MKTVCALIGVVVLILGVLGSLGIGHFRINYSIAPETCVKAGT